MEKTTKDLVVTITEDRPGLLQKAADSLAQAGVNIDGFCAVPWGKKEGIFHFITNDPLTARIALEKAGFTVKEEWDALVVDIEDRVGTLATLLKPVAQADVNLRFSYSLVGNKIALGADDLTKLREIIRRGAPTAARA